MDPERKKRRQSLKIIISEAIMVLTVAATVIILALLVSGYWLNSDFEVERQGMLQIYSAPTGADVAIDGETAWLQRTNTSKVLPSGEHSIVLTRDGYDSWSKTVNISEGLLYRLHYPRLFPLERRKERAYDAVGTTTVFVSPSHESMLLFSGDVSALDIAPFKAEDIPDGTNLSQTVPNWTLINLGADDIEGKTVTLRDLYNFFRESKTTSKDSVADFGLTKEDLSSTETLIFSKFYEDRYLTILDGSALSVYKKGTAEPIFTATLGFTPEITHAGHEGEFVIFSTGSQIAALDMESLSVSEWQVDGSSYGWLDNDMIYSVKDGELFVYDFDGLNRRSLATNVSERFPVFITNDKWLYYFSDDNLMREDLIAR